MVSVSFQFRTWNANGLLLFSTLADGMLELVLKDGKVMVHISVLQLKSSHVDMASGMEDLHLACLFWEFMHYCFIQQFFSGFLKNVAWCRPVNTHRHT